MRSDHERDDRTDDAPRRSGEPDESRERDDDANGGARRWLAAGTSIGIIGLGVLGYLAVGWLSDDPEPREPGPRGPLVEVERVRAVDTLAVASSGFVRAAESLTLSAEVSGRVTRVSEDFRVGRRIAAGESVVELEHARFEAELDAAEARVAGARARLETARSNVDRQRRLDTEGFAVGQQLEEVETAFASAEAELALIESERELAAIALDDTRLIAPYDALVSARDVSLGQIVGPGTSVGELVAAARAEIRIGLLPRQRALLAPDGTLVGRSVNVFATAAGRDEEAAAPIAVGRVAAIDPVLDPVTRTLGLVVDVDDPFASGALSVGELVEVVVPVPDAAVAVYDVPARALKGADRLWVVDDGTLRAVEPEIVRRRGARVQLSSEALREGDRVLVTDISAAVDGLAVRVASGDDAPSGGATSDEAGDVASGGETEDGATSGETSDVAPGVGDDS